MKHFNWKTLFDDSRHDVQNGNLEFHLSKIPPLIIRRLGLVMALLLCMVWSSHAQETWIGLVDGDWTKNGNWIDGTAPLSGVIPGNGLLTINAGAPNAPITNVPDTIFATELRIGSPFMIAENFVVIVDGSTATSDGVSTFHQGDLTVFGKLIVDNANMDGLDVGTDSTNLFNFGTIEISNAGQNGVLLTGTGTSAIDGIMTIDGSSSNGLQTNTDHVLDHRTGSTITITNSTNDGIQNGGTTTNSGTITVNEANVHGIQNSGTFTNDSLAAIIITNVDRDGINTAGTFNNAGGNITVGNGTAADIGNEGIEVTAGIFNNFSTVAQGGGLLRINGTTGNGLVVRGTFANGAAAIGDTLGTVRIDNVNGSGVEVVAAGTLNNTQKSTIEVNANGGNVQLMGLIGGGTVNNNDGSFIYLDALTSSAATTGIVTNNGILEIVKGATFMGGLTNTAIIKSSAPISSVSGTINNTGIIIDPNNSFGSDLAARTDILASNNGVIVAPFSADCYADTIANFLITDLSNAALATFNYLPSSPFTMTGFPNAATLDAANNVLRLNMVQSLMNFQYTSTVVGTSCTANGTVDIAFANVAAPAVACNQNIQLSLDADCIVQLTPDVILEGSYSCYHGYTVEVLEGAKAGTDTIDGSYLGQTVRVMVNSPLGNSCWGTVTVEDKLAPICQSTQDTTFFCGRAFDPVTINTYPVVVDACGTIADSIYRDSIINFASCGGNSSDVDTLRQIVRTWTFFDDSGNSVSCTQNLYELKPTLSMVRFPESLTGAKALSCGEGYLGKTGYPYVLFGTDTILVNSICKFGIDSLDNVIEVNCPGKQRISRTWYVTDWCALGSSSPVRSFEQFIDIVDTIAPTILATGTATVIKDTDHDCAANVQLSAIGYSDNCTDSLDVSVIIIGPSNTVYTNGGIMPNVPFGTHNFIYIVGDGCGNETRDTVSITVDDQLSPTAIAASTTPSVTLIDDVVLTWVNASTFDGGSLDNCALDSVLARKTTVDTFSTKIGFTCFDIGVNMIELKVVDKAGNSSLAWTTILVEDKFNRCPNDNDEVATNVENPDPNGDGNPDDAQDTDGDGIPDYLDPDDDNDGVLTINENPDPNGDGDNSDAQDTDGDGIPDYLDPDDDNDGIWTIYEANIVDNDEPAMLIYADTNEDGIPDYLDPDDDGDSILTIYEEPNPVNGKPTNPLNTDGDEQPNYLDNNDDGDGIATRYEAPDANSDGNPNDARDINNNGIPDYLDNIQNVNAAMIAGHIQNENGEKVESVSIAIDGYEMAPTVTGADGTFQFDNIPVEGDYMITPTKDMNYGNGVTTFDIVLLSKHILGLKALDSPYKMIAGDINHSGSISAYDMVLLRQVILGIRNDFPNNTSWRFIDAAYEFTNPQNPFNEKYPEAYEIKALAGDMMTLDFMAIKVGDLNNTAQANNFSIADDRTRAKSYNFKVAEQIKTAGELVQIDFRADDAMALLGYQFTLDFDGNALQFEQIKIGDKASFDNFNLSMVQRGIITTSWNQLEAAPFASDEVLFSLVFKAKSNVTVSEAIGISSDITAAEAYTTDEEIVNVGLRITKASSTIKGFKLYQNQPNPFTGATTIGFELPAASETTLTILDMSGKILKTVRETYEKGYHQVVIDEKAFTEQGIFYYQLATDYGIETKKMILIRG